MFCLLQCSTTLLHRPRCIKHAFTGKLDNRQFYCGVGQQSAARISLSFPKVWLSKQRKAAASLLEEEGEEDARQTRESPFGQKKEALHTLGALTQIRRLTEGGSGGKKVGQSSTRGGLTYEQVQKGYTPPLLHACLKMLFAVNMAHK